MANKLLGQHFLKDATVIREIIDAIDPQSGDRILEVGPGHGELTRPLAEACAKNGGMLTVIEKDKELAKRLENDLTQSANPALKAVTVIAGDVLELLKTEGRKNRDHKTILSHAMPSKIVGNIPYYLTGHLLRLIGEMRERPARCALTIQREVAERITASAPDMNKLAASLQFWGEPEIAAYIPKAAFDPVPKVDSALIVIEKKQSEIDTAETDRYYRAVHAIFAQPRKTVFNNLRAANDQADKAEKQIATEKISRALAANDISPSSRPQDLTVAHISALAKALF